MSLTEIQLALDQCTCQRMPFEQMKFGRLPQRTATHLKPKDCPNGSIAANAKQNSRHRGERSVPALLLMWTPTALASLD